MGDRGGTATVWRCYPNRERIIADGRSGRNRNSRTTNTPRTTIIADGRSGRNRNGNRDTRGRKRIIADGRSGRNRNHTWSVGTGTPIIADGRSGRNRNCLEMLPKSRENYSRWEIGEEPQLSIHDDAASPYYSRWEIGEEPQGFLIIPSPFALSLSKGEPPPPVTPSVARGLKLPAKPNPQPRNPPSTPIATGMPTRPPTPTGLYLQN